MVILRGKLGLIDLREEESFKGTWKGGNRYGTVGWEGGPRNSRQPGRRKRDEGRRGDKEVCVRHMLQYH